MGGEGAYNEGRDTMTLKITASVKGAIRRDEQTGVFVAFCPALQVYSQGTDEPRAQEALKSAVVLFLSTCIKHAVLDEALKERGFSDVANSEPTSPKQKMGEYIAVEKYDETFDMDVPLYLLQQHAQEAEAS
jgi:hypothetical protein